MTDPLGQSSAQRGEQAKARSHSGSRAELRGKPSKAFVGNEERPIAIGIGIGAPCVQTKHQQNYCHIIMNIYIYTIPTFHVKAPPFKNIPNPESLIKLFQDFPKVSKSGGGRSVGRSSGWSVGLSVVIFQLRFN